MTTTTLDLKVTADAKAAVHGLKPLNTALEKAKDEAQDTEHALKDLSGGHKIKIDDDAVDRARREITRLRAQIRDDLRVDVNADTKTAERRIRELSRSIKAIDNQEKVEVKVDVDKTGIGALGALKSGVGGLGGPLRALGSGVAALTLGLSALGVAGVGAVGWTLKMADQLANAKIAFTQFLGSGQAATKFLDNLQGFAAKTPFEFPELVDSSKKLLAFGIDSKEVIGILTSLGDAAALTGADVGDLTTIWGQMAAKGKVSNEELLQLTEAGVPAYQLLADKMHLSVAEVQDMATKGKLLSDTVLPVLQGELDKTFGGGMQKQAKTLGGMFSTLKDTLGQFATRLGEAFTPVVGEQIEKLTGKLEELSRWASENKETLVVMFANFTANVLDFAGATVGAFGSVINAVADLFDALNTLKPVLAIIHPAIMFGKGDFGVAADNLRRVGDGLKGVGSDLRGAGADAREAGAKWAAAFRESDNIQRAKNDLADVRAELKFLRKQPPSPEIDLRIEKAERKARRLRAYIRGFADRKTAATLDVKIDKAQKKVKQWRASLKYLRSQKPTTEVKADIRNAERQLKRWRDILKGVTRKRVIPINVEIREATDRKKRLKAWIDELKKKPPSPKVEARTEKAQANLKKVNDTLNTLRGKKAAILNVKVKADTAAARQAMDDAAKKRSSKIEVGTTGVDAAKERIEGAAKKRDTKIDVGTIGVEESRKRIDGASKKRAATIHVGTEGVQEANKRINDAARNRTSTIYVKTVNAGRRGNAGPTNDAPGALSLVPQLFGSDPATIAGLRAVARAAPQMVAATTTPQAVATAARKERAEKLRPRQTPVQVFLDGAVIADQVSLRSERMAVASTTRRRGA